MSETKLLTIAKVGKYGPNFDLYLQRRERTAEETRRERGVIAMKMTKLNSSYLDAVGYDGATQTLRIAFRKGRSDETEPTFDYAAVPPEIFERIASTTSPGAIFHRDVKGKFEAKRVADPIALPDSASQ